MLQRQWVATKLMAHRLIFILRYAVLRLGEGGSAEAFVRGLCEGRVVAIDTSEEAVYQTIDGGNNWAVVADNQFECDDDEEQAK